MKSEYNARLRRCADWFSDLPWTVFFVLVLSLLTGLALWKIPKVILKEHPSTTTVDFFERENSIRRTLAQSIAGIVIFSGAFVSIRTLALSREGHLSDRYFNAIEKLSANRGTDLTPDIESRLGAIYGLERLALDSPRDQWFIMEILTEYVRYNAIPQCVTDEPRADVQAALTVIGRRRSNRKRERPRANVYLSLMGSRLCNANLSGAILRGVDLEGVDLKNASLWGAQLQSAALMEANLAGANLRDADLTGAFFRQANLEGADIQNAHVVRPVNLTLDQIRSAKNWELAKYSPDLRRSLGLSSRP